MNLYLIQSKSTMSKSVVAASNEDEAKQLLKYNYNLSDGDIILISNDSIYLTPCVVLLHHSNESLYD